ncbi:Gfo/Idh/MocA family oxidoreductase [Oscillibacter sp. MSJ-31]|uniref:Gfo/Idh/MocA family oxidoreductase n=1 Tax=Oscillibacter sp. MSJ-31 TaxID=2841526 RepID=UPI001C1192B8|nr:Gfo/Idh/MocA family oxidoreductase [Oscillibacter sp. MSJ-31]MBU5458053.1 adenylyltransferase/cytidyltransferase family protein [Oscillibacter sp. MSJ-31]
MVKVITYGTYDLLHYGHIRLLERAKALGDYLIVGVTSDDYDKTRGKINLQQSLMERIEAVKATGIPDEVIVEEYEGQKIDDIQRYNVDIFAVGSDWVGYFDYLNEYCKVVYLPRTEGVSSTEIRTHERQIKIGFVSDGEERVLNKFIDESQYVNGLTISGICSSSNSIKKYASEKVDFMTSDYEELLKNSDAVYIISHPRMHFEQIKQALTAGKHVLVEAPIALTEEECKTLFELADKNNVVLMESIKTAYSTAYNRLLLLVKSGKIGRPVSIDATCTSIRSIESEKDYDKIWNSISAWGPTAVLPIFQILGTNYQFASISSLLLDKKHMFDAFTKVDFIYNNAVASLKVGRGVKSEGELIISGTKGYLYVPAPWWKTDYFEIRYENQENNKRYFYQLDGEGIRYELVAFVKAVIQGKKSNYVSQDISLAIAKLMRQYQAGEIHEL